MSKRTALAGALLDAWRPPKGAGEPVGCLATTYTFAPGLFDEQCLARFLEIESEPNRESLAFLLERESRLGSVYAGVLVDHTQAGVEHSLRWDVLPVRVSNAKQHAKLSLLAWSRHVRVIVASANLTEQGYRMNYEVAGTVDLRPERANLEILADGVAFLRSLLGWVPAHDELPVVRRAEDFLSQVERQVAKWRPEPRGEVVRQQLVFTSPGSAGRPAASALEAALEVCRGRGGAPSEVRVVSPFFEPEESARRVASALCKPMARGVTRTVRFGVPAVRDDRGKVLRLAAPKGLWKIASRHAEQVEVEALPDRDPDKNHRIWHGKLLALRSDAYSALMVGSSNFTCWGMGVGERRHTEANLVTIADRVEYGREVGQLEAIWPNADAVKDPESMEWMGTPLDTDEEELAAKPLLPLGFLSATYRAGDVREVVLHLLPIDLPEEWSLHATGRAGRQLLDAPGWREAGSPAMLALPWEAVEPPERILVRWSGFEAFLPLNVEDGRALPPPAELNGMTADEMLLILAASDPSAAFRVWAKRQQVSDTFDGDLDSASPVDLDPLRRFDLQATFLHRVRRRARILASLRANLERPCPGPQALEWRLRGLIGVQPLAEKLVAEVVRAEGTIDEALLTLADFLIVLREVDYQPTDGMLSPAQFERAYRPFLSGLAAMLQAQIEPHRTRIDPALMPFWERVVERCRV